jgi:hypothetical protein
MTVATSAAIPHRDGASDIDDARDAVDVASRGS